MSEETRLERAHKFAHKYRGNTVGGIADEFANAECAALEKENADKAERIESLTKKLEKIDGILSLSVEEVFFAKKPVFENAENYLAFRVGFTACWKYLHGELGGDE
jgi:hypothetical protein